MDTALDRLKQLLKQHIGLDANTVGKATIKKILHQRMRSCGMDNSDDYFHYVDHNPQELAELLETAVIPETWFFRDSKPFAIILQRLQQHLLSSPQKTFNILSIPCSTGEEPCSLTMFLLQAGIDANCFHIDAVDISNNALQLARLGAYGKNSFRGQTEQLYLDKYFLHQDELFIIDDSVKQSINFRQVNILDSSQLPWSDHFHVILCRNLLIYFDVATKQAAFNNLHHMLKDDGILFIGHSEFGAVPRQLFVTVNADNVFGLVKSQAVAAVLGESSPDQPATTERKADRPPAPEVTRERAFASAQHDSAVSADQPPADASAEDEALLEQARKLADQGSLDAAEQLCLRHVDRCGDSAESFFLLGLINQAAGNTSVAEPLFRKALYLQPRHYEALVHLALIVEQSGDHEAAELLRQRAQRSLDND